MASSYKRKVRIPVPGRVRPFREEAEKKVCNKITFKMPKTFGECADLLYKTREDRLVIQKQIDALSVIEGALREMFISKLPKSQASGVAGKTARVQIEKKQVPNVRNWPAFYAYVKKNNAFELLQRRLNDKALEERLAAKKKVPGIGIFTALKVSCTKL